MRLSKLKLVVFAALSLSATSAMAEVVTQEHASLSELQSLEYSEGGDAKIVAGMINSEDVRLREVRNTALALGAQHGYIFHMNALKKEFDRTSDNQDRLFDFNTLMKVAGTKMDELHFLPPVITEIDKSTRLSDSARRLVISDKTYNIERAGRLVTVAPNWRQYLVYDQHIEVTKPVPNLLPRDSNEKKLWKQWVQEGWAAGYQQADQEMVYRVRKLGKDFNGMVKYIRLVSEGKINKPVIVSSTQDIVGGGKQMTINEHIVQLAVPASLNSNENDWEALILDSRESLRYPDEQKALEQKYKPQ